MAMSGHKFPSLGLNPFIFIYPYRFQIIELLMPEERFVGLMRGGIIIGELSKSLLFQNQRTLIFQPFYQSG